MSSTGLPQEVTDDTRLLQKSEKWNGKPRVECVNGQHPPSKTPVGVLPWTCRSERDTTEQTDWQAKQPSQVACISEDLKCGEARDTTCRHKAKGITPSIAWRHEAWKEETPDDLLLKDERGPTSIRRTLEPFQRQRWGNF